MRLFTHYGDLTDPVALTKLLYELQPDEIYHLGAQSHVRVSFDMPEYTVDVTGVGTLRILEAIREAGVETRFYQASSSEMFGSAPAAAERDDAVPPAQPLRAWPRSPPTGPRSTTARPTACSPSTGSSSTTSRRAAARPSSPARSPAPSRGSRPGLQDKLYLGNLDAKRDWGYAPDLRRGDVADAAGRRARRLRDRHRRDALGARVRARPPSPTPDSTPRRYVEIDPRYFRPAEVDALLRRRHARRGRSSAGSRRSASRSWCGSWSTPTSQRSSEQLAGQVDALQPRGTGMSGADPDPRFWSGRTVVVTGGGRLPRPADGADARGAGRRGRGRPLRPSTTCATPPPAARPLDGAEVVIHLAANVGGIGFNRRNPAPLAHDNLAMGLNVFEACRELGVGKLVAACSVCAYPKHTPVPFREDEHLERLPGGVERPLRPGQADAARPLRRLPAPVRPRLVRAGDRQPLRARRQLRPRGLPRDRGDGPQVRRGRRAAASHEVVAVGHRRADARVPLRRRRGASAAARRRARSTAPSRSTSAPAPRPGSATSPRRSPPLAGFEGETVWDDSTARRPAAAATSTSAGRES